MVHTRRWRGSRGRNILERIGYPLVYLINRPGGHLVGSLIYDFALRCNGVSPYPGKTGLARSEEKFLRRVAPTLRNAVVLDVGARFGAYASLVKDLAPGSTIYAFEPHPGTFPKLQETAALKGFTAIRKALSNVAGAAKLYDFSDADGLSSQASLGQDTITFQGNAVAASHDIESARLDDVAEELNLTRIGLLKIDTEGFDLTVLQGAPRLIAERRIQMIQFEVIPADIVRHVTVKDFFDILDGYRLHRLCANGQLQALEPYSVKSCEIYVPNNLVATLRS